MKEIELGNKVKDKITGFTGIAVSKVEYLHDNISFYVLPSTLDTDGKYPEGKYIDWQRLDIVE